MTPNHYKLTPEPVDVINAWGLNFCEGNALKYIARAGCKAGQSAESDLIKAIDYLLIELSRVSGIGKITYYRNNLNMFGTQDKYYELKDGKLVESN